MSYQTEHDLSNQASNSAKQVSQMEQSMTQLEKARCELAVVVDTLEQRLNAILRPHSPQAVGGAGGGGGGSIEVDRPPMSPLAAEVAKEAWSIMAITSRIHGIMHRVEL